MNSVPLLSYWPPLASVEACIRAEAETVNKAVFLGVHQPIQFIAERVSGTPDGQFRTEAELLDAFMVESPPEGRVILPIVGNSGVGKSHVIRWLDAQLDRHPKRNRLHVIRIPKGSSLKSVLRRVLEGLKGPAYEEFRKALQHAHEQLDPELATKHLLTNLAHQLVVTARGAKDRLAENQSEDQNTDRIRRDYGGRGRLDDGLPALLTDPVLASAHFLGSKEQPGIVARLAEQVTREGSSDVDQRRHQFAAADLVLPPKLIENLHEVSAPARKFYTAFLMKEDGRNRENAAGLLNEVLDAAKQELLRLGDNSLTDLFAEVRAQLLRERMELVLLVEDFAVLSGLQGALLDVMIREAFRDGKQVLCTIRSALAYTKGYQAIKETVLTRARVEWSISETFPQGDRGVFDRAVDLVAGYLNAARLGVDRLQAELDSKHDVADGRWVPRYGVDLPDDEAGMLSAFGTSSTGIPLFPFNREAIEALVAEGSRGPGGRPIFNPRSIINNVLHAVLQHRPEFERGEFPPDTFGSLGELSTDIQSRLQQFSPAGWRRYALIIRYWCALLAQPGQGAALRSETFRAFGLPPPPIAVASPTRSAEPVAVAATGPRTWVGKAPSKPPPSTPAQVDPVQAKIRSWEVRLAEWHQNKSLEHADANQLRQWIASGIMGFIPWDVHMIKPSWDAKELAEEVYIPGTKSPKAPDDAALVVCSDAERLDEGASIRVRNALLAIIRYEEHGRTWDHDHNGRDSARYATFMTEHVVRVVSFMRERPLYGSTDLVKPLVETLLVGARCLGAEIASNSDDSALVRALFEVFPAPPPAISVEGLDLAAWDALTQDFAAIRVPTKARPSARDVLLDLVGARRGGALQAVDVAALAPTLKSVKKSWRIETKVLPPSSKRGHRLVALTNELQSIRMGLPTAVAAAEKALGAWRGRVLGRLGDTFDKDEVAQTFTQLVGALVSVGCTPMDIKAVRGAIKGFQDARVKGALEEIGRLDHGKSFGPAIGILASLDRPSISAAEKLISKVDDLLREAEGTVRAELDAIGPDPVEVAREGLLEELEGIQALLGGLRKVMS